jgi:hypothetical protein
MKSFKTCPSYILVLAAPLWLGACATAPRLEGNPNQQAMVGKTKEQVLACAGQPVRETTDHDMTLLRYYREAPMFEESFATPKASRPGIHHGCWATVVIEEDRVSDVIYRFVPRSVDASNDCEAIFDSCVR